jgi:hypothetical protein
MPDEFAAKLNTPGGASISLNYDRGSFPLSWTGDKGGPNYEHRGLLIPSEINSQNSDV